MDARTVRSIEKSVERTAAALFGGAAGYAVYAFVGTLLARPVGIGGGVATLIVAAMLCGGLLSRIGTEAPEYDLAAFDFDEVESEMAEEVAAKEPLELEDALELDDVLAEPTPDSRVVRMFAPEAMPAQIDGRPDVRPDGRAIPDAARDLYEALADLRRSLR